MLEPDVRIRRERCGKYNSIKRLSGNFERMTGFTGGTQKSFEPVHKEIKKINKRLLISVICAAATAAAFCIIFFTSNRVTDNKLTKLQQTLTGAGDHIISYTENALHSYEMGLENWRRLDYGKAERDISRALEEITKTGSESDIEVARINNSLGCLYLDMGRLTEAYDLLNSAYITFREAYGENEPETVAARFSIAQYDYLSGDTNKSLRTIQRIIDELDTESNSAIAVSVLNYQAGIYNELGKYDEAIKTYEAALSVYDELINTGRLPEFSRMSGDASLKRKYNDLVNDAYEKIALTYNDLGGVYILQEDSDKAKQILQKGLDICLDNKAIGLENLTTSKLYMNMARACGLKNNLTQGIDDVDLAVRIQKKLFDFEAVYPGLVQVYCVYGELLERKDDFDTAYSYYQNAVSLAEESYGENHPVTAEAYYQFGRFFLKRNIPHAAVENIRRGSGNKTKYPRGKAYCNCRISFRSL